MTKTFDYTWEHCVGLPEGYFFSVELELEYELFPSRPQTYDHAGEPAGVLIYGVTVKRAELHCFGIKSPLCVCFKHALILSAFERHQREQAEQDILAYISEREEEAYIAHKLGDY